MAWESKDPLNYFAAYDSSSDSENSDSGEEVRQENKEKKEEPVTNNAKQARTPPAALPKPDELFKKISKPSFLHNPLNKEIDWDRRVVKAPEEPPKKFTVWKTNAVPPPETYTTKEEKKPPPPGMDMAIKWSNVYVDNGDDAPQPIAKARFLPEEEEEPVESDDEKDEPSSAKKCKVDHLQQKEKKKK